MTVFREGADQVHSLASRLIEYEAAAKRHVRAVQGLRPNVGIGQYLNLAGFGHTVVNEGDAAGAYSIFAQGNIDPQEASSVTVHFDLEIGSLLGRQTRLLKNLGTVTLHEHPDSERIRLWINETSPNPTLEEAAKPLGVWFVGAIRHERDSAATREALNERQYEMSADNFLEEHSRLRAERGIFATVEDIAPLADFILSRESYFVATNWLGEGTFEHVRIATPPM